jgi:hypothetical protein
MNLEEIAPIIEAIIKETLAQKRYPFGFDKFKGTGNKIASGTLYNSVRVIPETRNDITTLNIEMAEYQQWVQSGRLPRKKFVPIKALLAWIKARRIKGRDKKGRFMKDKSLAFAIQKNINKFGIRPANFLDISFEKILEDERILDLLGGQAFEDLIDLIEGI